MPTLRQCRAAQEQRHAALFTEARRALKRLTDAASLGTIHAARLNKLARYVRFAIREHNAAELRHFLALWEPCFRMTIEDAQKAATAASMAVRIEVEKAA